MVPARAWSNPHVTATESYKLNCELKEEPTKPPVNLVFFYYLLSQRWQLYLFNKLILSKNQIAELSSRTVNLIPKYSNSSPNAVLTTPFEYIWLYGGRIYQALKNLEAHG